MCVDVTIGMDSISSVGQLRERFTVLEEDVHPDAQDDDCLCGVAVEDVLNRSGVSWTDDVFGYTVHSRTTLHIKPE